MSDNDDWVMENKLDKHHDYCDKIVSRVWNRKEPMQSPNLSQRDGADSLWR